MNKVISGLQKLQIAVGGFFLLVFLVTVTFQILSRYLGIVALWTEDVAMYSFIWAVFMGAAAMVYERRHFAFTSLSDMLTGNKKTIIAIIISCIMLFFAILMLYYGYKVTKQFWNYKWVSLPDFKRGPTWLCLPVCGATSAIYLINHIITDIKSLKGGKN